MTPTAWLYDVDIAHVRVQPVRHEIRYRTHWWLVDLDDLPKPHRLVSFESRDHLGDQDASIRANVDALLAAHGVDRPARVTMLTSARSAGYVFNPLSVFWAHDADGAVTAVVAEVHNTYRDRHAYVLHPDDAGRAETAKQFYVSPFYDTDGSYRMSLPEPDERLAVTVTLHREGEAPFVASVRGTGRPASRRVVTSALLRDPLVTRRARAAITAHGVRLWTRGVAIADRPQHDPGPLVGSPARNREASREPSHASRRNPLVR